MEQINFIPIANLMLGFVPVIILISIMKIWGLSISSSIYANFRMLIQLLLIGYVLTYIFETNQPLIVGLVVLFMILMSAWIAMRPLKENGIYPFVIIFVSLALSGLAVLFLISQFIIDLPRWFEPSFVVPIAGMIFANSMNTVSLAGERFFIERGNPKIHWTAGIASAPAKIADEKGIPMIFYAEDPENAYGGRVRNNDSSKLL